MPPEKFWKEAGSSKASGARFLKAKELPEKYTEKFQKLEDRILEVLRREFNLTAQMSNWRKIPRKQLTDFGQLEVTAEEVVTDCQDKAAFALRMPHESMDPQIKKGACIIVAPTNKISNGQVGLGILHHGGLAIGIYTRLSGVKLKFVLKPYNPVFPPQEFQEKDFPHGVWPIFGTYTQFIES